ncbi:SGNH/GDSL hydrolase family protein [Laspinema palackyanum]|uniref:SGNH/GDSL hydrolase family protein n=1 Tax=Laspinema palackyanum TaxID=3231601 RepID=UPI00345DE23A|nr:GDSL-type esterase/lipase family protein [Laspinema sp. D2c]
MVWSIDSSIYEILAGLSEADIRRSLVGNNTPVTVESEDAIAGDSNNDLLLGDPEDDLLIGDLGNDTIYGGTGNNTLFGGTGHLSVEDWEGQDLLVGGPGEDLIFGNQADDTLYGGDGNDTLYGGKDSDRLYGNRGNDLLFGDLGSDTLWGGEGQNRFQIGRRFDVPGFLSTGGPTLDDADWIMDFTPGQDLIALLGGLTFDELNIFAGTGENAGDAIIQDTITQEYLAILKNISPEAIVQDNFWPTSQPPLPSSPPQNPPINPPVPADVVSPVEEEVSPVEEVSPADVVSPVEEEVSPADVVSPVEEEVSPADVVSPVEEEVSPVEEEVSPVEEEEVSPVEPNQSSATIAFSTIRYTVLDDNTPAREITLIRENDVQGEVSVTVTLHNGTTTDSGNPETTSIIVKFADGEPKKTIAIPLGKNNSIERENTFSIILSDPTGEATIKIPYPVVVTLPEQQKPDSIILTDENLSEIEEQEISDLEPDISSEIEKEEPSDLEANVPSEIEEEEDTDLEVVVPSEIEEEEDTDLEPDVSSEIEEEDNTDLEPDVPAETEEEEEEEPIPDEDEIPPIEDEEGDDTSGEIEDEPVDEDADDSSGEDSQIRVTANYSDATSGIIADLSEESVTRLFTTDEDVPFKILPLGDSNTRGYPNQASLGGYRTRLWERLVENNGFNIDFVGQANSGPANMDRNHEGRGGFTITQLIDNRTNPFTGFNQPTDPLYTTIEDALNYAQPDAVLLMAGTNDILQDKPVGTALTDLGIMVDRIVATLPNTQVLVSSIIPNKSKYQIRQQRTTEFSEKVEEIVVEPRANNNPNIRFVDMFNLPFVTGDYDNDGIHLTASGYDKLADEWYSQIRMLPSGEETLTDVHNIVGSAYDDTLIGNDESNEIRGGEGNDWLSGGAGEDTFILASGEGTNTIADFQSGIDRIGLTDGLEFEQLVISSGSETTQTQIAIADTGESLALLLGIDASMINADDFILV